MLLQFSIENYLSYKDEVLLNLIPAKSRTMNDHIIEDGYGKNTKVLPIATIYGANASGKTNLVNAFEFIQRLVVKGNKADSPVDLKSFLLDPQTENEPSRFEIVFKHDGVLYTYGFVASTSTIFEEWLFARFTSKESKLFERITVDNIAQVEAGDRLIRDVDKKLFIDFVARGTRPNQLFLNEAHDKNIEILAPVVHWFKDHLQIIRPKTQYLALDLRVSKDQEFSQYLSTFLSAADTGIQSVLCQKTKFNPELHLQDVPDDLRPEILESLAQDVSKQLLIQGPESTVSLSTEDSELQFVKLKTRHKRSDGTTIDFDPSVESDGTRRLMHLAPMLRDIWERDKVYIVDELDRSLHTHLSRFFIQSLLAGVSEQNARGQLIFTTHDTNLLDRQMLRRDEIWFVEKDTLGSSRLTSLAEYNVTDGLNFENGYLNGRFGAIPFVGDPMDLFRVGE